MPSSGASAYAAINARVRVMYSTLLTRAEFSQLTEAVDFNAVIAQLKHTAYGPYLEKVSDKDINPRRAAFQIRSRLADAYSTIIHTVPTHTRPLLTQLYRYFEVNNLKAVLRGIVTGASWDRVRYVLFPLGSATVIPAQEMVEAGSVNAAIELMRGTPYYEVLSFASRRFSAEQSLFPLEVALDLNFWRELRKDVNQLPSTDRTQALRIIGTMFDTTNLMWAIRYRTYHHLSEEELINYTLPFGYRLRDEDIRAIAAGADIAQVVRRIYPQIQDVDSLLQEGTTGLPRLELKLRRLVVDQCHAAFVGNPFHIGIPIAFLFLADFEIQDLVVLFEAKSTLIAPDDFRQHLLMGAPEKA
jgi:V/A-type H+-transporting ATPase subunit C